MPNRNAVKQYVEGGYYHLYNRGVEKRVVFLDEQDYRAFMLLLRRYLLPPSPLPDSAYHLDLSAEIDLIAYCLMPNHFHLLVKQHTATGITSLMRCVITNYVMYFNQRHNRVGSLFQGKYKARLVTNDTYLQHLSRYIHLNPVKGSDPLEYPYSSYRFFIQEQAPDWLKPAIVMGSFPSPQDYRDYVTDYRVDRNELDATLTL